MDSSVSTAIGGVFFDLGGTLFSYHGMNRATGALLVDAAKAMGGPSELQEIGKAYQRANQEVAVAYADKAYYLHADLFHDTFKNFADHLGVEYDPGVYNDYQVKQHSAILDALELKSDCLNTLKQLRARGLYLSIVSNIDDAMLQSLVEREGLHEHLDHWTSSEAAQSCKPDPKFFEVSLAKAKLPAEKILFVGDSPEHDVAGASACGMRTVLITEPGTEPPLQSGKPIPTSDHQVTHLAELLELV